MVWPCFLVLELSTSPVQPPRTSHQIQSPALCFSSVYVFIWHQCITTVSSKRITLQSNLKKTSARTSREGQPNGMRGKQAVTFPCAACSRKSASLWRWPEDGWPSQPQDSQQVLSRYHWIPVIRLGLSLQWLIFIMFIRISRLSNGPSITNIDLLSIYLPVSALHPAVVRKGKASTLMTIAACVEAAVSASVR